MAENKIRADTQTQKLPPDDQMSDILLLVDNKKNVIEALSKIDKNGKAEMIPAEDKNQEDFLRIDKHSSIVENFISNFWRQFKNPTHFSLIKMAFSDYRENRKALSDIANGRETDQTKEFLKKYKIIAKDELGKNNNNNEKNEKIMATQTNEQTMTQQPESGRAKYRFNENMIDFDQLKAFGLSKEYLQQKGLLEPMMKGQKTNVAIPISMNFGSAVLRTDARLSFQQSLTGPVVLAIHGIRKEPSFSQAYFGHIFSEQDKKNLLETGNMGRVVDLKGRDNQYYPSFISIDKITNEIVSLRAESAFIPDEVKDVKLTEQEKIDLKEGKAIYIEGMTSAKGTEFNAHLQINADRRGIEYIFENDKLFNSHMLGGVEITKKQQEELNAGRAIYVEDMERKDGTIFTSFVTLNKASGKPDYTSYNPDSPEGAREIVIPKELYHVTLTPEDRQLLSEGKPVFLENMINREGREFSSFVLLDMETGRPMTAPTPDGFKDRVQFKIPPELWGKTLTATQRAGLQDGKAVLVEGMIGVNGKEFAQYVKKNSSGTALNYFDENPDRKKIVEKKNTPHELKAQSQTTSDDKKQKQDSKLVKNDTKAQTAPKKSAGRKVS